MDSTHMLTLDQFTRDNAVLKVIDKEKGYVDDPDDLGGETNFGITKRVAELNKNLWSKYDWDGEMSTMPKAFAMDVYALRYWDSLELDTIRDLHPLLADSLFDCGVNCGVGRAAEWLQRLLNVNNNKGAHYPDIRVDGDIGPTTLRTLKAYYNVRGNEGIKVLLTALMCMKGYHYVNCSEARERNERFTYGWLHHRIFADMKLYMDLID